MEATKAVRASKVFRPPYTEHERRVRAMMIGFGQDTPETPTVGTDKTRITRTRLDLEEALEFAKGAAIGVYYTHPLAATTALHSLAATIDAAGMDGVVRRTVNDLLGKLREYLNSAQRVFFDEDGGNLKIERDQTLTPDLAEMIDACSDMSVVNTGAFVAFGVMVTPMLELTDENNLMKIANGKLDEHGKFRKHPNHPKPNYEFALSLQGYDPATDPNLNPLPQPVVSEIPPAILDAAAYRLRLAQGSHLEPSVCQEPNGEPQEPSEPKEPGEPEAQPLPRPRRSMADNHDIRDGQPSEKIYSGRLVDQLHQMLLEQRTSDAARILQDVHRDLALMDYDKIVPLRITGPGDKGPRGIVFKYVKA